jgi:hypothetical protein
METNITTPENISEPVIVEMGNQSRLVSSNAFLEGDLVFTESCLVEDGADGLNPQEYYDRYNERWSWSIVEEILKRFSSEDITKLLTMNFPLLLNFQYEANDFSVLVSLAKKYTQISMKDIGSLFSIVTRNNISTRVTEYSVHYGLYMFVSFINHSCEPNVQLWNHGDDVTCHVTALKPIAIGEPIVRDYLPEVALVEKRQALLDSYGIRCRCQRCVKLCSLETCLEKAPLKCPCSLVAYCSKEHQREDWKRHKSEHL